MAQHRHKRETNARRLFGARALRLRATTLAAPLAVVATAGVVSLGIPGFTSVVESQEFLDMHAPQDIMIPVSDFDEYGHDYYGTEDAGEWWTAVTQEFGPMWAGEDTVENSTQRATDAVNEIFSRRGSM